MSKREQERRAEGRTTKKTKQTKRDSPLRLFRPFRGFNPNGNEFFHAKAQRRKGRSPGIAFLFAALRLDGEAMTASFGFRVILGKRFTGSAAAEKRFKTLASAREFVDEQVAQRSQLQSTQLSPEQISEAKTAFSTLEGSGLSLAAAVAFAIKHGLPETQRTFAEVVAEFLASRIAMDARGSTMSNYRSQLGILETVFGKSPMNGITTARLEGFLDGRLQEWKPRTRKNYIVTLATMCGYAKDRGYCAVNAAEKIGLPMETDKAVGILKPAEATALLKCCLESDPAMLHGIVVQLFAGLRRSEVCALEWDDFKEDLIEVTALNAKGRKRRLVTINDTLNIWLRAASRGEHVTPSANPDVYGDRLLQLSEAAGIMPWPHNALRHSFGSYHLGLHLHEGKTATEMGNTPDVVINCYREVVRPTATKAFWALRPPDPAIR